MTQPRVGRGLALGDFDNDGRLDVVINNLDGTPEVLHNELPTHGNWLMVKLKGDGGNTDAIGAVVTARAGTLLQTRVVQSGASYISQNDMRLHFGLGSATAVESVDVRWPDGTASKVRNVKANQLITVKK
jgi:hypothetical protein